MGNATLIALCLFSLSLGRAYGQYHMDTSYQWNGTSYTVFRVVLDSAVMKGVSIVENPKRSPEESIFPARMRSETFAVTGCIVDPQCRPLGLYVTGGKTKKKLNLGSGSGNFYELTNGVVAFTDRSVSIGDSRSFIQDSTHVWALQTGPMLVDGSRINPQLRKESANRQVRVGVGLSETAVGQELIFVRSNEPVNFHHIASLFMDRYACKSALCLESGTFSSLRLPGLTKGGRQSEGSCIYLSIRL